jgi:hypothetical protein
VSGTTNYISKFTNSTSLGDSKISQPDANNVLINFADVYSQGARFTYVSTYVSKLRLGRTGAADTSNVDIYYDIEGAEIFEIRRNYAAATFKVSLGSTAHLTIASSGAATFNSGIGVNGYSASTSYAALFNGSVGIGTSTPITTLQVANTSSYASPATTGNATGHFTVGKLTDSGLAIGSYRGVGVTGYTWLQAQILDAAQYNNDLIFQPNGGVVGIGSTASGINTTSLLNIKANSTDGNQIYMIQSNDDRGWRFKAKTDGHFYLQAAYTSTNTDRLKIEFDTGAATFTATTTNGITIITNDVTTLKMRSSTGGSKSWGFATTNLVASDFGIYQSTSNGGDPISAGSAILYFNGSGAATFSSTVRSGGLSIGVAPTANILDIRGENSTYDGTIVLGARGTIQHRDAGQTIFSIANDYNSDLAKMEFRMKGNTSADAKLTILGSGAATFSSSVTVSSGKLTFPGGDRGFECIEGASVSIYNNEINSGSQNVTGNLYLGYRRTNNLYLVPPTTFSASISGTSASFSSTVTATQFNAVNDRNYLARGSFRITSSSNNASTLDISVTDSTTSIYSNYYSGGTDNTIVIATYANITNQLVLKSSGNVGIGLASPQAILDVSHTAGTTNIIRVSNGSGNYRWRVDQNFAMIMTNASGTDTFSVTTAGLISTPSQYVSYSTAPFSLQSSGNTATYTQTTIYANQNNTSGSSANGIFIERGRLTDSASAEVRYLVIGARGGNIQWMVDGSGYTTQYAAAEVKPTGDGNMFIGRYSGGSATLFRVYQASADGYLELSTGANQVVTKLSGYTGTAGYTLANFGVGITNPGYKLDVDGGNISGAAFRATKQQAAGDGLVAYFTNSSNSGYSSYIYIGSNPGTDWKIGKNISNPTGATYHFEIVDSSNNLRLQINNGTGNATFSSDIIAYSDIRFKTNIRAISNPLERVLMCNGILYDRTDTTEKDTFGFIAQELEKVFPELVTTDDKGIKGVKYQNATVVLFEAIKELKAEVDSLRSRLDR